jgi:hypothetical protein
MIEPLESRIAPAAITLVAYNYSDKYVNSKGQTLMQFYNAADPSLTGSNLAIAKTVGQNSNVYFMKISSGEDLKIYNTQIGAENEVNVVNGTVVAFFTDAAPGVTATDPNGVTAPQVLGTDLTGLALGNKVSAGVGGGVYGDIVTNYNDLTGTLGGLGEPAGTATQLLPNLVTKLSVAGPVTGSFIAGANVSYFSATQSVGQILTGTAANGYTYAFENPATVSNGSNAVIAPGDVTLVVGKPAAGVAGPSLANVAVGSVNTVTLGNGGPGAAGGSLNGFSVLSDFNDITVTAGTGGAGIAGHITGGAGGSISNVVFAGSSTPTNYALSNALINFQAGNGGAGYGSTGHSGAGGSISNVYIGYTAAGGLNASSTYFLPDDVLIQGGTGGSGAYGGAGGSLTNVNILTSTPHLANSTTPEIQLLGGTGGTATVGAGGKGGSIATVYVNDAEFLAGISIGGNTYAGLLPIDPVTNLPYASALSGPGYLTSPTLTEAYIHGGDGGAGVTTGGAGGSLGGSVPALGLTLEGYNFSLVAGNGMQGHVGGAGGAINNVTVLGSPGTLPGDDYHVQSLYVQTGAGGAGTVGAGGNGGSLYILNVNNASFGTGGYNGLQIVTGAGGTAAKGAGGAGGNASLIRVTGIDFLTDVNPQGNSGTASIVAGNGGDSPVASGHGGAGGSISNAVITATRLNVGVIEAGNGGKGGVNASTGTGGAGGSVSGVAIGIAEDQDVTFPGFTTPSTGLLDDPSAAFGTDGVVVGDTVINNINQQTTTVTAVTPTELTLMSDIFAAGDSYTVVVPNGATPEVSGTTSDPGGSQDTIIDANSRFDGVAMGDVVYDVTDGLSATVTSIADVAQGILNVSADISHVGDQYVFSTLGGVAATPTTILVDTANFLNEGIPLGATIEDVTATQANIANGINTPVLATVSSVAGHELTVVSPTSAAFGALGDQYSFPSLGTSTIIGGTGGAGVLNGAGGAGGSVSGSHANIEGTATFIGGIGGGGGSNGAAGAGGSLNGDATVSIFGSGIFTAGHAGDTGAKPGAGGSISGAVVNVLENVTLVAGYGTAGGAGGSVNTSGYSGVSQTGSGFVPNTGNVTIQAGAGGTSITGAGGAGGNVNQISGFISSGDGSDAFLDQFVGGAGGGGLTKAGAGGSVEYIHFFGGGGEGVTFFINAGDAGNTSGHTGAAGGSVYKVGGGAFSSTSGDVNFSINPLTDFHHISAGNGGNAAITGGAGGSVSDVYVNAAIGVRTGDPFGFDIAGVNGATVTGMGGISVGIGGTGGTKNGLAGNVTSIQADAIASIVAGRLSVGAALQKTNLANEVSGIFLNGSNTVGASSIHDFTLTFNGETTAELPSNATAIQVAAALNALGDMAPVVDGGNGGVSVSDTNGVYTVTFNGTGVQSTITGQEASPYFTTVQTPGTPTAAEVENVKILATSPYTLSVGAQTTTVLNYTGDATKDATKAQDALNSILGANTVTVTETLGTANAYPVLQVTYNAAGAQALTIVPNFQAAVTNNGSNTTDTVETITLPTNTAIDPAQLATANFVGSIVDPVRPNATVFSYTIPPSTTPVFQSTLTPFQFGDSPIDGLIAALTLTSNKTFKPQVYLTEDSSGNAFVVNNVNG